MAGAARRVLRRYRFNSAKTGIAGTLRSGKSGMNLNGYRKAKAPQEEPVKHGETLIVGLGEVGSALAEVLERKSPVLRHDIEPRDFDAQIGVMHICIPFQESAQFEKI